VTFPTPLLDDRDFQSLVNEARGRVAVQCPEWTEHNLSDPGITLIETFAWMTEMLVYRLNRLPESLHEELLKLVGIELAPPMPATAQLRFTLAGPPPLTAPVTIAAHDTEVTTATTNGGAPVVFRVAEDFTIEPLAPIAFKLQRAGAVRSVPVIDRVARGSAPGEPAFSPEPRLDDALYLGFAKPLDRLVMRVDVEWSRAQGVGIDPTAPPLRWEVSQDVGWSPVDDVLTDTTAGFNVTSGRIELQLPERSAPAIVGGTRAHWLRCRVVDRSWLGGQSPRYVRPPRIQSITASPTGALVPAKNSTTVKEELLGESNGSPGQTFRLRHQPALEVRRDDERLEVREPGTEHWVAWQRREAFDRSGPRDPHYHFDARSGEITLGPAIRERGEVWRQHGQVPLKGSQLRMRCYRYGGGERGTVAARTLTVLRTPIAGVASVTNPAASEGQVEAESIEAGRMRAAQELRTGYRAVTADDFEFLAGEASVNVSRVRCGTPPPGQAIPVRVLPAVASPVRRALTYHELTPPPQLLADIAEYLDERRLVGTKVDVLPVPLRAVTVVVDAEPDPSAFSNEVEQLIRDALYTFVNPIVGGNLDGEGGGWEFGRALKESELQALVHDIPGVRTVRMVRMYETDLRNPDKPDPHAQPVEPELRIGPDELLCSAKHRIRASHTDDPAG
jgi:predicted phage baseplate assembly protein